MDRILVDGVTLWKCKRCAQSLPPSLFYADKRAANGIKTECKKCHIMVSFATRDPDLKRLQNRKYMARKRAANPQALRDAANRARTTHGSRHKTLARKLLESRVRRGKILKPDCCGRCSSREYIQAHHSDYSKPYDVTWLCASCHAKLHATR